jgi:HlyD family secretion protein
LITVADPSSILVEVLVDEADIADVSIGQKADVFAVAYPDRALTGTVQNIATSAKRSSYRQGLSFTVKILLESPEDIDIRPGMSCRAEIFTKVKEDTIAVPIEAVLFEDAPSDNDNVDTDTSNEGVSIGISAAQGSTSHLFIIKDGIATRTQVELGISNDSLQEITSGITLGDRVVVGPARVLAKLEDGDQVEENEKATDD